MTGRRARPRLSDADYRRLLQLRTRLRGFLHWSEAQAKAGGLTPAQHQLLLAVRGHDDPRGPTMGDIADYLYLRPHSAVGLVDRADQAGWCGWSSPQPAGTPWPGCPSCTSRSCPAWPPTSSHCSAASTWTRTSPAGASRTAPRTRGAPGAAARPGLRSG